MELNAELNRAVTAAKEAGSFIMAVYGQDDFEVETKGDNFPLTKADRGAHDLIVRELQSSGLPVLSEEGRDIPYNERRAWKRFWLVDPLDGTREFISRNGDFTVNIALVEDGSPVLGVVFVPVADELYFGTVDKGSFYVKGFNSLSGTLTQILDGAHKLPLAAAERPYRVVGSRSHMDELTTSFIDSLKTEYPDLEIVQRGSALKICMIAAGDADIYPRFGPTMEWDTAAGQAVVTAAGKSMVDAETGDELVYNKEYLRNPYFIVW